MKRFNEGKDAMGIPTVQARNEADMDLRDASLNIACVVAATVAALLVWAVPLGAHHAASAQFDMTKPLEISGIVTRVEWTNPHARFLVDVRDAGGAVSNWSVELASPNILTRNGYKSDTIKVGDVVTVTGYTSRTGGTTTVASGITTADGRKLFVKVPADAAR